jgi:hypothetical protein
LLLLVVPVVSSVLFVAMLWSAVADIRIDTVANAVTGFNGPAAVLASLFGLLSLVSLVFGYLAAGHQLYFAQVGQPVSVGRSISVALGRLPLAILWGLVLAVGAVAVVAVLYALPVGLALVTGNAGFIALFLLTVPVLIWLVLWLGVRLTHVPMAIVVGPRRANPISVSMSLTKNRWLGHFGRLLLLGLIVSILSLVVQVVIDIAFQAALFSRFGVDPITGELQLNGQDISTIDVLVVRDFLPSLPVLLLVTAVAGLNQAVSYALGASGAASLYRRAGGSAELDY